MRSSLRYTSKKHWGQVCREMREIYTAPTVDAAQARFDKFAEQWRAKYPAMIDTWERPWPEFVPFLEDVGEFVAWLRRPPGARFARIVVLPSLEHHCGEATVNRKLSAVSAFYQHAARNGVGLGGLLTRWQPSRRGGTSWRPFLHHISKSTPHARREIRLKAAHKQPRVPTVNEVQAILDACDRLRDWLLFAVLHDSGMRVGEALGLRHEDWQPAEVQVTVTPRTNDNGARSK